MNLRESRFQAFHEGTYGIRRKWFAALIISLMALAIAAGAKCPPSGCGGGLSDSWETRAQEFLKSDVPLVGLNAPQKATSTSFRAGEPGNNSINSGKSEPSKAEVDFIRPEYRSSLFIRGDLLKPMPAISSTDVVLDVSNKHSEGQARVKGAINLPVNSFLFANGTLKPDDELSRILGEAGISRGDSLVIYSDRFGSGEASLVFWILRYLGHEDVKVMDGDLGDWTQASLPLETKTNIRPPSIFNSSLKPELLASYDYVKSGASQVVDARSFQDFGKSRIQHATFISPESLLENDRMRPGDHLNQTFARLDKGEPVVVYSDDLLNASLVWYALQLMDFDSGLYTWQDWEEHRISETYVIG